MKKNFSNILLLILFSLFGCSQQASRDAEVKIDQLKKQIGDLSENIEKLNREIEVIAVENERLSDRNRELGEWADRVVDRFGEGIWYMADLNYPLFVESMEGAPMNDLIEHLNRRLRKDKLPEVLYLEKKGSTVFVGVSNDDQLNHQLGSFGASSYINAVVFSLASMDDVSCVAFKFEGGDHAVPGTYCRTFLQK